MEGLNETVLPSKINSQSVGESGVTTSLPQPQTHLCIAVQYSIEIYKTPSSILSGINSTNLYVISFIWIFLILEVYPLTLPIAFSIVHSHFSLLYSLFHTYLLYPFVGLQNP